MDRQVERVGESLQPNAHRRFPCSIYLGAGAPQLTPDEEDYAGLGALDPDDPSTIYVSSPYDPTTDTLGSSGKHEIWRGTTCDHGATFTWTPVTANSTTDNLRPIVPK